LKKYYYNFVSSSIMPFSMIPAYMGLLSDMIRTENKYGCQVPSPSLEEAHQRRPARKEQRRRLPAMSCARVEWRRAPAVGCGLRSSGAPASARFKEGDERQRQSVQSSFESGKKHALMDVATALVMSAMGIRDYHSGGARPAQAPDCVAKDAHCEVTDVLINKTRPVTMGKWDARRLSVEQVHYAYIDVFVSYEPN
jgi:hypothetical protein